MYQDAGGKRLTLYVSRSRKGDAVTAFRFAREGNVSVFYWIDDECGYALSGEVDKPTLARVASAVYKQLQS
jgi:anti-sigma factor RsiW